MPGAAGRRHRRVGRLSPRPPRPRRPARPVRARGARSVRWRGRRPAHPALRHRAGVPLQRELRGAAQRLAGRAGAAQPLRERCAEASAAAGHRDRRADSRLRPLRARRRVGCRGARHHRKARRRRLCPQRNQDLVHARQHRRRPHGVREDRPGRRPPGNHRVPGGEGNPGLRGGPRREPRRASRLPAVHGPVHRRARAGRASSRRGGRRIPDRDGGARRGPAELLGSGPRRRVARHPRGHLARQRAHRLRPADHRVPGGALPAGGAVHGVRRGARAVASGHRRVRGRPDPKVRGHRVDGQERLRRHRDEGAGRSHPDLRRHGAFTGRCRWSA